MILDGKKVSQKILENVKKRVEKLNVKPHLVVILVGEDPASRIYVKNKQKVALEVGIKSTVIELPTDISQSSLLETIKKLNEDTDVTGILVQLPLPKHIDKNKVIVPRDFMENFISFVDQEYHNLEKSIKNNICYENVSETSCSKCDYRNYCFMATEGDI